MDSIAANISEEFASSNLAREEYSTISEDYAKSKLHPWRRCVEEPTLKANLMPHLPPPGQRRLLELACGAGHYTSRMLEWGLADFIHATDISEEMIVLANEMASRSPFKSQMSFEVADATVPANYFDATTGPYHLCFAAYLLNYANSRRVLLAMCQTIRRNLTANGVFVTFNDGISQPIETYSKLGKYGFIKELQTPLAAGEELPDFAPIVYTIFKDPADQSKGTITFTNYRIKKETLEWAFREAGFSTFRVLPLLCDQNREFFEDFVEWAPVVMFEAKV